MEDREQIFLEQSRSIRNKRLLRLKTIFSEINPFALPCMYKNQFEINAVEKLQAATTDDDAVVNGNGEGSILADEGLLMGRLLQNKSCLWQNKQVIVSFKSFWYLNFFRNLNLT